MKKFRCEKCGKISATDTTDEEAENECYKAFGKFAFETDMATVCDDCYESLMVKWNRLNDDERERLVKALRAKA